MVRLKPSIKNNYTKTIDNGLNSTMVRLKHGDGVILRLKFTRESQFHYGSIKTMFDNALVLRFHPESQFHYGSIKTVCFSLLDCNR